MQTLFINNIPLNRTQEFKTLLPSAPGYISMEEIKIKTGLSFFCKFKEGSILELKDYLRDVLFDLPLTINEAIKI